MRHAALAGLRAHLSRVLATGLAVMLSVGFVVATLILSATFTQTTDRTLTATMAHAVVRVGLAAEPDGESDVVGDPTAGPTAVPTPAATTGPGRDVLLELLPAVRAAGHVVAADVDRATVGEIRVNGTRTVTRVSALPVAQVRWQVLAAGTWPVAPGQVTLDASTAETLGLTIGDRISLAPGGPRTPPIDAAVVGTTSTEHPQLGVDSAVTITPDSLSAWPAGPSSSAILVAGDGAPDTEVAAAVSAAVAGTPGIVVQTHTQAVEELVGQLSGSATILTTVLMAFAVIALFVAGIVITNTFQVLVAQRTRELALMRCLGASSRQVSRLILTEAAVVGAVSATAGVLLGIAGAAAMAALSRSGAYDVQLDGLVVDPVVGVVGFVVGVLLTVVSALPPARRATRVRPVEALRPDEGVVVAGRRTVVRLVLAVLLVAGGTRAMVDGAHGAGFPLALLGGMVSFLGVLVSAAVLVPVLVRAAGATIAWTSVPARLASLNAIRHPRRTAATASALLVGVTLVTMMVVGETSVRTSVTADIDVKRPIDLVVQTSDRGGLTADQVASIVALSGIDASAPVLRGRFTVTGPGTKVPLTVRGLEPDAVARVAHAGMLLPSAGELLVSADDADRIGATGPVTVKGSAGTGTLTMLVDPTLRAGVATVTTDDLRALVAETTTGELVLRLPDGVDAQRVTQISSEVLSLSDNLDVSGGAAERVAYGRVLDTLLLIVLALLTIAVVIAVVGIGNTLALAVVERRRESALVRALGLTAAQLRGMLATEAVLVAVVAAAAGTGLGVLFGWAGVSAIGSTASKVALNLSVPWDRVGSIAATATVAGLLASLAPAAAAARQSPVEALARE